MAQQHAPAVGPKVEKQIDRGEAGDERRRAALRIDRVVEFLEHELDARLRKRRAIEVMARAAEADEQRIRADGLAEIEHQLALRAADVELGAVHERRADGERLAQELEQRGVEIGEALPWRLVNTFQRSARRAAVGAPQRLEMRGGPVLTRVDRLLDDALLLRALRHWHGEPVR